MQYASVVLALFIAAPSPPAATVGLCRPLPLIADLEFVSNTTTLANPRYAVQLIARMAQQVAASGDGSITVVGHSELQGTTAEQVELSMRRAETVVDALVGAGADRHKIIVQWHGARDAIALPEAEHLNRRVVLTLRGVANGCGSHP